MNLPNDEGLTDAVREFKKHICMIQGSSKLWNMKALLVTLSVLTSGTQVPNPTEVLGSKSFADYMKELKKHFDFIIVDCSPVLLTSDLVPVGTLLMVQSCRICPGY